MIPDCYDPVRQAEGREAAWDKFVDDLPVCKCCGHSVYPGDTYHENANMILCRSCMIDLNENEVILEVI